MVDGIKLFLLHQPQQMRELHGNDALRLEDDFHAGNKIINIRNVGKHVVAEQKISFAPAASQFGCGFHAEEFGQCGHPRGHGHFGDVLRGFYAQNRDIVFFKIL